MCYAFPTLFATKRCGEHEASPPSEVFLGGVFYVRSKSVAEGVYSGILSAMRICIITTKYNFKTAGGSVGDIDLRARFLTAQGHTVTVVSAFSKFDSELPEFPYTFKAENIGSARLLPIQVGTYRLLKKYESATDIFHVDGQVFLYGAGFYRLMGGKVPVLGFFNHWLSAWADETVGGQPLVRGYAKPLRALKKKLRFLLERALGVPLGNRMDVYIYNTPQVREKFVASGFKDGYVRPDFADTEGMRKREAITPEKVAFRQKAEGKVVILCAGRMLPEKGFDMVLRAFVDVPHKERYRIILSGTGPELSALKKLCGELKLESHVEFPGWVERETLFRFFREAHIFIFPNWWAEYGSVALEEAMSLGLASIIPAGGALEWLSGGTALTFSSGDIAGLAKALQRLGEDEALRVTIAQKSLAHVASLDYRVLGLRLEEILRKSVIV